MAMKSIIGLLSKAKKKVSSLEFWPKANIFKWAMGALILCDLFDLATTVLTLSTVITAHETNPFMVNTVGNFLIWKAIKVKTCGFLFAGGLGYLFYKGTGDKRAFAVPPLYLATTAGFAGLNNLIIFLGRN